MALQGGFKMVATGTPLENHLGDLWNLFRFINPGLLGSHEQFNLRFAGPIERQQDHRAEVGARNRLRRLIGPFVLRRTKAQVLSELPARTEIVLEVDLSPEETALYESLRREALENLASIEGPADRKSMQILAEIMKLRRACCNPNLVAPSLRLESSKLAAFARLLEGLLENRHKVLVFSQFVDHLALIRAHLDRNGIRYQYLDGSTPMAARKQAVDAFQAGEGDVFLISLKAGGVGINLTAADYVIHMDPWWNPAVEDQASDRAHRMGQLRPVTIYRLVARNTIEEGIVELHAHKRELADSLLEGSDTAARMTAEDMLAMLNEGLRGRPL
jgi:SNF2 family DNA or RNA helicase